MDICCQTLIKCKISSSSVTLCISLLGNHWPVHIFQIIVNVFIIHKNPYYLNDIMTWNSVLLFLVLLFLNDINIHVHVPHCRTELFQKSDWNSLSHDLMT